MSPLELFVTTLGMAAVALACRAFFLLPKQDLPMPQWLREGLRYAPTAALAAVVAPELVLTHGHFIETWRDARLPAVAAATLWYVVRPGVLGPLVAGLAVFLPLRLAFGW